MQIKLLLLLSLYNTNFLVVCYSLERTGRDIIYEKKTQILSY